MIQVKSITVDPVETHAGEFTVDSFREANAALGQLSQFAPETGAYHKCDFMITFEDGFEYTGRYDLQHWSKGLPNLQQHIQDHLNYYQNCPDHLEQKDWETHISLVERFNPGVCERIQKMANSYDFGA